MATKNSEEEVNGTYLEGSSSTLEPITVVCCTPMPAFHLSLDHRISSSKLNQ